jgi:hypothetical protein
LPNLGPVPLPQGRTVHDAGDQEKYLYFLTAGIVSRFYVTERGASAKFAVSGNEGVIELPIGNTLPDGGQRRWSTPPYPIAGHADWVLPVVKIPEVVPDPR